MDYLSLGIEVLGATLLIVTVVVFLLNRPCKNRRMTALTVFLGFLLSDIYVFLGDWLLVPGWIAFAVVELYILTVEVKTQKN